MQNSPIVESTLAKNVPVFGFWLFSFIAVCAKHFNVLFTLLTLSKATKSNRVIKCVNYSFNPLHTALPLIHKTAQNYARKPVQNVLIYFLLLPNSEPAHNCNFNLFYCFFLYILVDSVSEQKKTTELNMKEIPFFTVS